jgi:hypothetical protein
MARQRIGGVIPSGDEKRGEGDFTARRSGRSGKGGTSISSRIGIFLSLFLFLVAPGWTQPRSSLIATPAQPIWGELSVSQKVILAPLADEWDSLEAFRRKQWLGIAARFPSLGAEEQRRLHGQMQKWHRLSPEERRIARENYKSARRLPADQRRELKRKWEEYVNLPEEEKEKLKRRVPDKPARPLPIVVPTTPVRIRLPVAAFLPTWESGPIRDWRPEARVRKNPAAALPHY